MKKIDNRELLVIDVERTCWEPNAKGTPSNKPVIDRSEIIDIGIIVVNTKEHAIETTKSRSIIVKPMYSEVSEYCTNLTGYTQKFLAQGISFGAACTILREEYNSTLRPWASWGAADYTFFSEQCRWMDIKNPMSTHHINLKLWHALARGVKSEMGLKRAMTQEKVPWAGRQHHALIDATAAAYLLLKILK